MVLGSLYDNIIDCVNRPQGNIGNCKRYSMPALAVGVHRISSQTTCGIGEGAHGGGSWISFGELFKPVQEQRHGIVSKLFCVYAEQDLIVSYLSECISDGMIR